MALILLGNIQVFADDSFFPYVNNTGDIIYPVDFRIFNDWVYTEAYSSLVGD